MYSGLGSYFSLIIRIKHHSFHVAQLQISFQALNPSGYAAKHTNIATNHGYEEEAMSSEIIETTNVSIDKDDEHFSSSFIDRNRLATLKRTLLAYRKAYEQKVIAVLMNASLLLYDPASPSKLQ